MIRILKKEDIKNVMPLLSLMYKIHQEKVPYFMPVLESTDILEERLLKMMSLDGFDQFVYEQDGVICAYMDMSIHEAHMDLLFPAATTMILDTLIVDPEYRGQKIADKLINFAKEHARKQGFSSLQLLALTEFPHLVPFYQKFGFNNLAQMMVCEL